MNDSLSFPALKALLGGLDPEDFFAETWRRAPRHFTDRPRNVYDEILTIDEIDRILNHGLSQVSSVITQRGLADRREHPFGVTGVDLEMAFERFRKGATLVLTSMHLYAPGLKALCRDLARETNALWKANIYVTPPNGQGFATHMDAHCVFVLQIYGEKTWRVGSAPLDPNAIFLPVQEEDFIRLGRPSTITLRSGDLLYVPRKVPHDAEASEAGSIHVTLGMHTTSPAEYYKSVLGNIVDHYCASGGVVPEDLPPGFAGASREAFAVEATRHLRTMLEPTALQAIVEEDLAGRQRALSEEAHGRLSELLIRKPIASTDRFRAATPHVTVRAGRDGDVEVLFSGKTIRFPHRARQAVETCLSGAVFSFADLAGTLDDDGYRTLIRRLLAEGLIERLPRCCAAGEAAESKAKAAKAAVGSYRGQSKIGDDEIATRIDLPSRQFTGAPAAKPAAGGGPGSGRARFPEASKTARSSMTAPRLPRFSGGRS